MEVIHILGPPTHQLASKEASTRLSDREQHYAHHLSRAAWHGSRIIIRQVSPEAIGIFDFIIRLSKSCNGQWRSLVDCGRVTAEKLTKFLEYASDFLYNLGNYFVSYTAKLLYFQYANLGSGAKEIRNSFLIYPQMRCGNFHGPLHWQAKRLRALLSLCFRVLRLGQVTPETMLSLHLT